MSKAQFTEENRIHIKAHSYKRDLQELVECRQRKAESDLVIFKPSSQILKLIREYILNLKLSTNVFPWQPVTNHSIFPGFFFLVFQPNCNFYQFKFISRAFHDFESIKTLI